MSKPTLSLTLFFFLLLRVRLLCGLRRQYTSSRLNKSVKLHNVLRVRLLCRSDVELHRVSAQILSSFYSLFKLIPEVHSCYVEGQVNNNKMNFM